jgi:hypothetical protein
MNTQKFINASTESLIATVLAVAVIAGGFFVVEAQVGQAATSGPFSIKTTITDEISFTTNAANVTATGSINGITGGTANGSTTVVVRTNDADGYNMSIAFFNNGTSETMRGDGSLSSSIHDYPSSAGQPTYVFSTASTSAVFGYTVSAADSSDVAQSFLHNGSNACNTPAGTANATSTYCWMEPTVAGFEIIRTNGEATNGATSTIHFRIHVPNNPTPGLVADVYTATATLTALNN